MKQEIDSIPFPKYCLKMATGAGKTWVLAAILVWQYFDFLFIVEHPRFRQFYEQLWQQGYLIGTAATTRVQATGDIRPIDAIPDRIPELDIGWPLQIFEHGKPPDLSQINVSSLAPYPEDFTNCDSF